MMGADDVAARFDLKRQGQSWRGRCPACGYSDSLVVNHGRDGRALFWCASCQDRTALTAAILGGHRRAFRRTFTGDRPDRAGAERNGERAIALWLGSTALACTLAERYLALRGLTNLITSPALRFHADTPHPEGGRLPALIALVHDVYGHAVAVHRTFLDHVTGAKAAVEPARASLGPVRGGAVRLVPSAPEMVVGEGVENSASAALMLGLPAWSAVSAGNLAHGLLLPDDVRSVVIASDPDEVGQRAAAEAWRRWTDEGRTVRIAAPNASLDFNDILCGKADPNA
jgi:hypothetical protein